MNHALLVTYNACDVTHKCIRSLRAQDAQPIELLVVDNASTDGTREMLDQLGIRYLRNPQNIGLTRAWNQGLDYLFGAADADRVLVMNNDIVMPTNYLSSLLALGGDMLSGTCHNLDDWDKFMALPDSPPTGPYDPAAFVPYMGYGAFLISQRTWRAVGRMEARMVNYVQDIDYEIRMILLGWPRRQYQIPYWHLGSHCLRKAERESPEEWKWMAQRGDADRAVFAEKWGFAVGSPEHVRFIGR